MNRARAQAILPPLVGGLLILVALIGLIGTAIKNPQPHDIKVGLVGPTPALEQMSTGFASNAPGAFAFATYASEDAAEPPSMTARWTARSSWRRAARG